MEGVDGGWKVTNCKFEDGVIVVLRVVHYFRSAISVVMVVTQLAFQYLFTGKSTGKSLMLNHC